jgi:hypothetical protein
MRRLCLLVAIAACYRSSSATEPASVPPAPIPAKSLQSRPTDFDWPAVIGMPEEAGIRKIAALLRVDDLRELRSHGIDVSTSGGKVVLINIHVRDERGDFSWPPYRGPLFEGLVPTMTRDEVIARLGAPTEQKVGNNWNWIKYDRPDLRIQFQFSFRDDRIETITLDSP